MERTRALEEWSQDSGMFYHRFESQFPHLFRVIERIRDHISRELGPVLTHSWYYERSASHMF